MRKPVPHAIAASLLLAFAGAAEAQGTTAAPAGRPVVPGAMTSGATANSSNSTAAARASLYPSTSVPSTGTGTTGTGTDTTGTGTNGTGTDTTGTTAGTTARTTASATDASGTVTSPGTTTTTGNTGSTAGTTSGTSTGSTSGLGATGTTSSTTATGNATTGNTTTGNATTGTTANGVNGVGTTGFAGGVILPGVATAVPFADPNATVDAGAGVNANGERAAIIGGFGTTAVQRAPAATPLLDATTKAATVRDINRRNRGQESRVYGIAPRTNNDRTDQMPDDPIIRY